MQTWCEHWIYICRARELLPVMINEDDAVRAERQHRGKKQALWIHVCLVSVALPGTCRLRIRAGWRERGVEKGEFGRPLFLVWRFDDGV